MSKAPALITGNEANLESGYRNCIGCGLIYPLKEYEARDSCYYCERPLTMISRKENRRRKEEGEDEEGLERARTLRDRLLKYDQDSKVTNSKNKIADDDAV